ncbi:hypothetical protein MMC18_002290 [Xylographa bjoerkii]|nr:hypothetical protein [Xylographa bjoerkii]
MPTEFLDLPREIRDSIYRSLLLSSQCFNGDKAGHRYEMHPAIIQVNRVISYEATRVRYQENDFVRIILRGEAGVRLSGWVTKIAKIDLQPWVEACRPALTVDVGLNNVPLKSTAITSSFLIFPESLEVLLECFLDYTISAWDVGDIDPIGQLAISLELRPTLLSKRRMTQEELLVPFKSLTGFADVEILGCIDKELRATMIHQMTHLPSPEQFLGGLEYFFVRGKEAYKRGCRNEARHSWILMQKYHEHIDTIIDSRFSLEESVGLLLEAVIDSRPMIHSAKLGVLKAGLHLKDYTAVLRDLREWDVEEEEMSPLKKVQFKLGMAMAFHAEDFIRSGREALKDAHDIVAIEAYRYTGQLVAIVNKISWSHELFEDARSQFFCAWEHCWELLDDEEELGEQEDASDMEIDNVQQELDESDETSAGDNGGTDLGTMVTDSSKPVADMSTRDKEYEMCTEENMEVTGDVLHAPEAVEQDWVDWRFIVNRLITDRPGGHQM